MNAALNADEVLRAASDIVWTPPFATVHRTDDFVMVGYPDWVQTTTAVNRIRSSRSAEEVMADVIEVAKGWERDSVWFCGLSDATEPKRLEAELLRRGGEVTERLEVLALDLTAPLPDLEVPEAADSQRVRTAQQIRDFDQVGDEAFENDSPNTDDPEDRARRAEEAYERGETASFMTYLDGRPAASGGMTMYADLGIALFWGGSSATWARGRGAYRSNLAALLECARDHGLRIALVKGRTNTSGPILRRAGFERFGEERNVRISVSALTGKT